MKKIIINLGLPKTGSTNLQTNIYPNLKNLNFIGRKFNQKNDIVFDKLDDLVENRKNIIKNKNDEKIFKKDFSNYLEQSEKNLLISQEYWSIPFTFSIDKEKYFINEHWQKLKRLNNFLKQFDREIVYFIVHRDPVEAIPSFFFTFHHMIIAIFGWDFKEINFFSEKVIKKDENFYNYNLVFDIYNLKKFKKFFIDNFQTKLHVIDFKLFSNDKKKFLEEILKLTNAHMNENLYNKLSSKVNVSNKNDKGDIIINVSKPNKILQFISFFLEKIRLKKILKRFFFIFGFKEFKKKTFIIKTNKDLLKKAIKVNFNS